MVAAFATAFWFGFRHGVDWDHIAALTDLTAAQETPRRSMALATLYALGHALVVFVLGLGAIVLADELPEPVDAVMERVVGATLVALGVYVLVALVRNGRDFRMRSRWMLVFGAVRRVRDHEHGHAHVATVRSGGPTAFAIGMLHGVGAETPTQVLLFVAAAGAGGTSAGVVLLVAFVVGLLASNTLIALAGTYGFVGATRRWPVYATVSVFTAIASFVIGSLLLVGGGDALPAIASS